MTNEREESKKAARRLLKWAVEHPELWYNMFSHGERLDYSNFDDLMELISEGKTPCYELLPIAMVLCQDVADLAIQETLVDVFMKMWDNTDIDEVVRNMRKRAREIRK